MKLDLISKYRTQLMGVAILWVMFYHSHINVEAYTLLKFIKRIGYGGVDIFMLLSGFGVYFSISKDGSTKNFYKKRALRILPYYLPIVLIVSLIAYYLDIWPLSSVIHNMLMTSFWFNIGLSNMYDWYIPALVFLYLMTPLFYKYFKKNKIVTTVSVIVFFYALNLASDKIFGYLYNFSFRVPLYILGFWLADFLKNHKDYKISFPFSALFFISLIVGIGLLYYFYFYTDYFGDHGIYLYPFMLVTFPLCLFLGYLFSLFPQFKFPVLTFFGTYTLTLYIFHEKILFLFSSLIPVRHSDTVAFIVTVILAYLWQKIVERIVDKVTTPKKEVVKVK